MRFLEMAVPGLLVGLVLAGLLAATDATGIKTTMLELRGHVFQIHPFLLALLGCIVAAAAAIQGGDFRAELDRWFARPLLQFLAHSFSIATGAWLPVVMSSNQARGATGWCAAWLGPVAYFLILLVMALLAVATLMIVEGRQKLDVPIGPSGKESSPTIAEVVSVAKATTMQFRLFLVIGVVSFFGALAFAKESASASELAEGFGRAFAPKVCASSH